MKEAVMAETLTTKEVAKQLKITPKELRAHLRRISGKSPGVRYEWKSDDPFLKKLPALIKEHEQKAAKK
jgi:hypothetical protein